MSLFNFGKKKTAPPCPCPESITDMEKVMEYGVMSMPAIVIDGKLLSVKDVEKLLWGEYR